MKEAIKVDRLAKEISKVGKHIKRLGPSRYKGGLQRCHEAMVRSINRLKVVNGS